MYKLLRTSIFIVSSFTMFPLTGQVLLHPDTINIKEVVITRKQLSSVQPGFRIATIDSAILKNYSLLSLAEVLNETSPLFMKYYGPGGTSTPSFRGTSAGHTIVMWNGININNPMPGQSDFSLLPAGLIDNIKISFGGASMDLGAGAIGAVINLETEPVWKKESLVELNPGTGSFGKYSGLVRIKTGTEMFQSVTKLFINSARNNFYYLNTESASDPVMVKRENNDFLYRGFLQEFYLRKSSNVLSARIWYQSADRSLPGSTLYGYSGEKQTDESVRSLVNYDMVKNRNEYFISAAWLFTKLNYTSNYSDYDSKNRTNTTVIRAGMTTPLGKYSKLKMVISNEVSSIVSNYYEEEVTRNIASATFSAERRKGDRFGSVLLLREMLDGGDFLLPDISAGMEYRVIKGEDHFIKLNMSRNSKIPSLNDCYWNPGGNPDLKNEYAYSSELAYDLKHNLSSKLMTGFELSLFSNFIRDMIQWRPSDSSFIWIADNIGSVNTSGFESSLSVKYQFDNLLIDLKASYSYNKASEIKSGSTELEGNQIIYIPKNQANGLIQIEYRNFYSLWISNLTGISYTSADNSEHLPAYNINSIISGYKINLKKNLIDIQFKIENLFNVSYQTIAYYPQPGRSYFFRFLLQLRK